jgi:hypothetical protein
MSDENETPLMDEENLDFEEKLFELLITVAFPLLVGLISFGSVVLAFSQWKLY